MKFRIDEDINGFLTFDLRDILLLIPKAETYDWFLTEMNINYIDPTSQLFEISQEDYILCENAIDMNCVKIEYSILERIAKSNIQIINGIILGKATTKNIKIEIFDSSYWTIESEDESIINNIKKRFSLKLQIIHFLMKNREIEFLNAVNTGNIQIVESFIKEDVNVNCFDSENRNALHLASIKNNFAMLELLLKKNINVNQKDKFGFTPLHYAAQDFNLNIAKILIEFDANTNIQDNFGNTPLFKAVFSSKGKGEMIQLLLSHSADPFIKNNYNNTPIDSAKIIANYDIVQYFSDFNKPNNK